MDATLRPDLDHVLDPLVADLLATLGEELVGLYLYGSAVSGGFDAGVSDLDLIAVIRGRVDDLELAALNRVHEKVVERAVEWRDRLEIVYVGRGSLDNATSSSDAVAVISPGEPFHISGPVSDWLQNWYLLRASSLSLVGPPASDVVPQISDAEFNAALVRYVEYLRSYATGARGGPLAYALLSSCRSLRAVATGKPSSKQEGAAWVRERMPDEAWLIDAALDCRLSRGTVGFRDEVTRRAAVKFVARLAERLRLLTGDGPQATPR